MKEKLRSTLAIAGLLSIMTFYPANAQDVTSYSELTAAIQSATGETVINIMQSLTAAADTDVALGTLGGTPVTINGGNYSITGSSLAGFTVGANQSLTLSSVGSYILNSDKTVSVENSFNGFTSTANGAAVNVAADGVLEIGDSVFSDNTTSLGGGAIYNKGNAVITGVFVDNTANGSSTKGGGGAIYNAADAQLSLGSGSVFQGNDAKGNGGAIYNSSTNGLNIDGLIFNDNSSYYSGGALYNKGAGNLTVSNSQFIKNAQTSNSSSVTVGGGALYSNAGSTSILGSVFDSNDSKTYGGAVMILQNNNLTIDSKSEFKNNSVSRNGGAVYVKNTQEVIINNSVFDNNNTRYQKSTSYGNGGAVYVEASGKLSLDTVELTNNTAQGGGGGLYYISTADDNVISIINSVVEGNTAVERSGGGILISAAGTATITGTKFTGNHAENAGQYGGGLLVERANTNIKSTSFSKNEAAYGGGLAIGENSAVTIDADSSFESNKAQIGGAVHQQNNAGKLTVTGASFNTNEAVSEGGALWLGLEAEVSGVTFTGNKTTGTTVGTNYLDTDEGGGAIFLGGSANAVIENSKFEGNSSGTYGGAIATRSTTSVNSSSSLTVAGSTFTGNSAVYGGAIASYVDTTIKNSNFSGNTASYGGAIYSLGVTNINLDDGDITFSDNTARTEGSDLYLAEGSELNILGGDSSAKLSLQSGGANGTIAGSGNITKQNQGILEITGNKNVDVYKGKYTQTAGTITLNNSIMFNNYEITAGALELLNGSTALVDGVDRIFNGTELTVSGNESIFDIGTETLAAAIGKDVAVSITDSGIININNGSLTLDSANDTWNGGDINTASNGELILDGFTHTTAAGGGNYIQNGGSLTLTNNSELTLGNNESIVTGGNVSVESGSTLNVGGGGGLSGSQILVSGNLNVNIGGEISGDANTVIQSGGTVTVDGGVISSTGATEIQTNANLIIQNRGEVTLSEGSIWNGTVTNDNSTLTLNKVIHDTVNGAYEQTNGNLYLENKTEFTLSSGSTITNGTVNVSDSSFVIGDGGNVEGGLISVGSGSSFEILEGGTMSGGQVDFNGDNVTVKVNGDVLAEAIFDVTKNTVVIESPGNITLNNDSVTGDMWTGGTIVLNGGALDFEGTRNGKNGTLLANSGDLEVAGGSQSLVIAQGSYIKDTVNTTINSNSAIDITGGSVALGDNSQWDGTINLANGSLDYSAQANGTLHADAGKLTTTAGSVLSINSGDYIKDSVNANIQGQLNISGTDADNGGYVTLGSGDSLLGDTNIENYGVLSLGDDVKMADSGQTVTFDGSDAVMNLDTNDHLNLKAELVGVDGQINKNGAGDVKFSGGTSRYQGNLLVNNSGDLTFVDEDGFGGNLEFGNIDGKEIGIIADKIHGEINQTQNAEITYSPYRNIDLNFNDKVSVSQGKLIAQTNAGRDVFFNSDTEVTNGSMLATNAQNSLFNNLALKNSTLQIMQNGFTAENLSIAGNSNVQLMNGVITDNNVGNINLDNSGVGNFTIDISPRDWTSDKILAGAITANGAGGTLNISDFQFLNKAPIDRHIPLQIFDSSRPGYENIVFSATDKEIFTPIGYYGLFPNAAGNGSYTASLTRYNPQVYRGQVATMSTWQNQLTINNLLFDHVQEINMQYLTQSNPNKYAALYPQFAPYQYNKKDGSLWFKPFGVIEKLNMTQGLNVNNTFYGALIGADFPAIELKRGWTLLPTAYIGYTGAHQSFNGAGMYQNGGQAGAMATFMKNDFIGSILAFGGGYSNKMDVAGYTDDTGNWIAGTAAKAAYNFHPSKHFVIQPTVMASYTYLGQQNWHTNFGDMSMKAEMLNGVNVAPGVNFIYGRETWSVYATVQYFYNILGYTGGRAGNDVDLPHMRMRHGFVQYGIGATKTWKDRFSGFLQVVIRNGGRTGVGFMGGITFKF